MAAAPVARSAALARRLGGQNPIAGFASQGQPIKCRALVGWGPNDLRVEEIYVAPPKKGEVRVKILANALCHTDVQALEGFDGEVSFPAIFGHESVGIVTDVGEGVDSVKPNDYVIPCYTPQCKQDDCMWCSSSKTNLCASIRGTQGRGLMPDESVRFTTVEGGKPISHFMGVSSFSEYTVLSEWSCAKIPEDAPMDKVCLFACGVSTGFGAVVNTAKVEAGSTVAVFGGGGTVGLSVVQAAKNAGAKRIFVIDTNSKKEELARSLGATDFVNPLEVPDGDIVKYLVKETTWGVDYTFDCTGNVKVMRAALESAHRGWGKSIVVGVAPAGAEIATRPFQLITGRQWLGTAFGGWKSRDDVPKLVDSYMKGELPIDHYVTHEFEGVEQIQEALKVMKSGDCLRAVVHY